jgi:hypothetical protein
MSNNDVFISYRRKDLEFVTQLHQELTNRGISAWFDMENIEVADHWRSSIAEGIRGCKVFVLVLSPDAVVSVNIRKEVDLAEKHGKKIVPMMWRQTEIPVAFEYSLAGLQWIDFKETASQENFDQLADVVKQLIGGSSMDEATSETQIAKESTIKGIQKEAPAAEVKPKAGPPRLGKAKSKIDPIAIGYQVISSVVTTTFDLDTDQQDYVNGELKWLFNASNHLLQIRAGEVGVGDPVPVELPPYAEVLPDAKGKENQVLHPSESAIKLKAREVETIFDRIKKNLNNLNKLLEREVDLGENAVTDLNLQTEIKGKRVAIINGELKQLAKSMELTYGIRLTGPTQLIELMEE